MSENVLAAKTKELYKTLCQDNWGKNTVAILVALLSIMMVAWDRPWGAVGAVRNWGEWIIYGTGLWETLGFTAAYGKDTPSAFLTHTGSVIGIGFVGGAFLSACLGGNFAFRIPPKLEMVKAVIAGVFMGAGATLAGGCNVGGFYNAIGNLSAHGFAMMVGLVIGAIIGLKYVFWEMENISWGVSGGKTINIPAALQFICGIAALVALIVGAYKYANGNIEKLGGVLLITAMLGYTFQRGRWCMIQGFREPHMTGNASMAKSVALSIVVLAFGVAVIKSRYVGFSGMDNFWQHYVRGTFGWGGVLGGILFAFGAIQAGGCGTGTLWRVGEGQIKLWIVTPFFGMTCAVGTMLSTKYNWEGSIAEGSSLGSYVYLPNTFGYGGTLALICLAMAAWYIIVTWNEETNKLMLEM